MVLWCSLYSEWLFCILVMIDLVGVEIELVSMVVCENWLCIVLVVFDNFDFDYVFVDCLFLLGLLIINVFVVVLEVMILI